MNQQRKEKKIQNHREGREESLSFFRFSSHQPESLVKAGKAAERRRGFGDAAPFIVVEGFKRFGVGNVQQVLRQEHQLVVRVPRFHEVAARPNLDPVLRVEQKIEPDVVHHHFVEE